MQVGLSSTGYEGAGGMVRFTTGKNWRFHLNLQHQRMQDVNSAGDNENRTLVGGGVGYAFIAKNNKILFQPFAGVGGLYSEKIANVDGEITRGMNPYFDAGVNTQFTLVDNKDLYSETGGVHLGVFVDLSLIGRATGGFFLRF